jgi:hypothetical protein
LPIVANDIKWYLSGGAGNSNPNLSIGGARSTTLWAGGVVGDLFDLISGAENAASDVEYRCVYARNEHATLTAQNIKLYLANIIAGGADLAIGLDPAGVNGTAATPADENTAPAGVTFSAPTTDAGGLTIANLAPNAFVPIWIRRTATNSSAVASDGADLTLALDTAA